MYAPYLGAARVHFKLGGPSALAKALWLILASFTSRKQPSDFKAGATPDESCREIHSKLLYLHGRNDA